MHIRYKMWKTWTLSYYADFLRELIKVAAMETQTEDRHCCEILFRVINRMCQDFVNEKAAIASSYKFNPILIKYDDHKSNRNGIEAVYGKEFLDSRTISCLYPLEKCMKKNVIVCNVCNCNAIF